MDSPLINKKKRTYENLWHLLKDAWNKVTELTVVNCFLKANFMYNDQGDLENHFNDDNDFNESFEDDDIPTVEPIDFCLTESLEINEDSNDVILDYENPIDDEVTFKSLSNSNDVIKALALLKNFLKKENPSVFLSFLETEKEITGVIESKKTVQTKITSFFM